MALPIPVGKQKEVLALPAEGHYIVLGTAGSGKTTLAIYRASYLAKLGINTGEKVLLLTFNKSLVTYLESISDDTLKCVDVRNYHLFARGYLKHRGKMGWNQIVPTMDYSNNNQRLIYIKDSIEQIKLEVENESTLLRAPEVFEEEISWIQKMGITTLDEYVDAERTGRRSTRITREKRVLFFRVYEKYLELRAKDGYKYDWDDIGRFVKEELEIDKNSRMYKHIIIDEGQDLSPVMLQSLAAAIPSNGSLTFFGDVAQQIYGGRISWRDAGINVTKNEIWKFDQNYRNSKEIAALAIAISKMSYFKSNTDLVTPKSPSASAPLPLLLEFNNEQDEINWSINAAIKLEKSQTVAILVRDRKTVKKIKQVLDTKLCYYQELKGEMNSFNSTPGISIGTYHSAKGLEFDAVLLPLCSDQHLPSSDKVIALESRDEALSEEIKLIYVAVTRAKRTLVIMYSQQITELLPNESKLYQFKKMF